MPGAFCTAKAPAGAMPGMASSESILAKAMGSRVPALRATPQPTASQIRSSRICKGKLTAHSKLHPCSLPFGTTSGRSKWLPAILWRTANPDENTGQHFCTATPTRRVSTRDGANDLISGENSVEALLKKLNQNAKRQPAIKRQRKMPNNQRPIFFRFGCELRWVSLCAQLLDVIRATGRTFSFFTTPAVLRVVSHFYRLPDQEIELPLNIHQYGVQR